MREIRQIALDAEQRERMCRKAQAGSIRRNYLIRTGELLALIAGMTAVHTTGWNPALTGATAACIMIALVMWDATHDYRKEAAQAGVAALQYAGIQQDAARLLEGEATDEESERARRSLEQDLRRAEIFRL